MFLCKAKTYPLNTCNVNKEHFMVGIFCVLILHKLKVTYLFSISFSFDPFLKAKILLPLCKFLYF